MVTRSAGRLMVGMLALTLLLGGCAADGAATGVGSAESPTPTTTPTLEPREIAAQIAAALPSEAELAETYETARYCVAETVGEPSSCGGEAWTAVGTVANGFNLREGVTDVTAGAVVLQIVEYDTDEQALKQVSDAQALDTVFTGDFDVPPDTSVGQRGTGTLVDFERDGWSGYHLSEVSEQYGYDGAASSSQRNTQAIMMTDGALAFTLRVYWASAEPGVGDAEVAGWLDRVLGPERTD
jgi:hypothetical protein